MSGARGQLTARARHGHPARRLVAGLLVAALGPVACTGAGGAGSSTSAPVTRTPAPASTPTATPGRPATTTPRSAPSTRPGPPAPPTSMFSRDAPRGPQTFGRADVDGDGRRDRVVVDSRGSLTVHLAGRDRPLAATIPRDPTTRLQALPDLDGDGDREILVASSASGCCTGYVLPNASSRVFSVMSGRLESVHDTRGRDVWLDFDTRRGDVHAGVRCPATGRLQQLVAHRLGPNRFRLTTLGYYIELAEVVGSGRTSTVVPGPAPDTSSDCPGLGRDGWTPR